MAALINGTEYSWSMIEFKLDMLQNNISSVSAISYGEEREITGNFGSGNRYVSKSFGNITPSASITMALSELNKISTAVVGGIFNLDPFSIVVKFAHPESGKTIVDTIYGCSFIKNTRDISQGDAEVNVELELFTTGIQFGDDSLI